MDADDRFQEANRMLSNALKQLEDVMKFNIDPVKTTNFRSSIRSPIHVLTQSGLSFPEKQFHAKSVFGGQAEHRMSINEMSDSPHQHHKAIREFHLFSPPPMQQTNLETANNTMSISAHQATNHAKSENQQQCDEPIVAEELDMNGNESYTGSNSMTYIANGDRDEADSPPQKEQFISDGTQIQTSVSTERIIWEWPAQSTMPNMSPIRFNEHIENDLESTSISSECGAESPPSVEQSPKSSANSKVDLSNFIKAIEEKKISIPDASSKLKILRWISLSSDEPPNLVGYTNYYFNK
ncbi:hypothetical protein DdX_02358 [Ditylenchus destructor]|uniref:Uncharacterized protein n=1 Tax=Ditylenchus destructor TaxID=166010 RepID=A0AAD4NEQ7_9BILA|nr:hypothetical protein DdX_02358 [Ditylenchus destructor]